MKHKTVALTLGAFGCMWICLAKTPPPFDFQCRLLDRVAEAARAASPARLDALEILERVATGRMDSASPELEARVGLKAEELRGPDFKDSTVRAHALRKIGETALDEAVDFLAGLNPGDIGPDPSQMAWPAAQIALRDAQLRRIADTHMKIEFLERTVTERHDAVSNGAVTSWAVDELCDRGSQTSLPVIQQSIRSRRNGPRDEQEIEFCEARIRVVLSNPNWAKALGSALDVSSGAGFAERRLLGWVIDQLISMRSPSADAELDRFAREIGALPEGSPGKLSLSMYRQEILDLQGQRIKQR
jgi:hypothetical protein